MARQIARHDARLACPRAEDVVFNAAHVAGRTSQPQREVEPRFYVSVGTIALRARHAALWRARGKPEEAARLLPRRSQSTGEPGSARRARQRAAALRVTCTAPRARATCTVAAKVGAAVR